MDEQAEPGSEELSIELPVRVARRGVESRIVLAGDNANAGAPDAALVRLITRAHRWNNMLATGEAGSLQELSAKAGIDRSEIGRVLQLAYLAPDITEAILDGRQPSELSAHRLKRMAGLPPRLGRAAEGAGLRLINHTATASGKTICPRLRNHVSGYNCPPAKRWWGYRNGPKETLAETGGK